MARSPFDATPGDLVAGTAIVALCGAAAAYLPIIGFVCFFFLPLPVMYYRVRFGGKAALIVSVASILILSVLSGGMDAHTILTAALLGQGLLLGAYVEQHAPIEKTIGYSTAAILGAVFSAILIAGNLTGSGGIGLVSEHITAGLKMTVEVYREVDATGENIWASGESLEKFRDAMLRVLPATSAAILILGAWINLLAARFILERAGFRSPVLARLNLWQAPEAMVWAVIGCGLILLLPLQAPRIIAVNLLIAMMTVYLLQGFAVISFYFVRQRVPVFIRVMVYTAVAIQQMLLLIVVGVGFFDTWFNIRRINTGENDPSA